MRSGMRMPIHAPTKEWPFIQRSEQYAGLKYQLHLLGHELVCLSRTSDDRTAYLVTHQGQGLYFSKLGDVHEHLSVLRGERYQACKLG
jgi:hypothetical protein